ncbi:hypothetical protein [Arcobacter sp.]|uniref:hypothetical protein n=1 Tax=Arcobacter sp. TaxID=1872629 RepID=UPI003D0ADA4E
MNLSIDLKVIKIGLLITLMSLVFGIGMGIVFGANEDMVKNYISKNIAENPTVHDEKSKAKIWRYAQRAHFHASGIAAYSLALLLIILLSKMKDSMKTLSSIFIGLGTLYPLSWFCMFLLAPIIGRSAAHNHILTESIVYVSVGAFCLGLFMIFASLCFNMFNQKN